MSIRLLLYALEIVVASLKIEKIIPAVKGLNELGLVAAQVRAHVILPSRRGEGRKGRQLGQPLDRAVERNGAARRSIGHGTKVKCVQT